MTLAAWITNAIMVLVGTSGSSGIIYWLLQRKSQERLDKKIDTERENLAAESAAKWQKLWDENAQKAYTELDKRCGKCENSLSEVVVEFVGVIAKGLQHLADPSSVDLHQVLIAAQRKLEKYT